MTPRPGWRVGSMALALVVLLTPAVGADKRPVKPTKEWNGSVADEALLPEAPVCLTSVRALEKLWKAWKIAEPLPVVDFAKELVVGTTTRGSRLRLVVHFDDKGNLEVAGLATRDLRPGFRYVLAAVSREGVKTVNGKALPTE